MALGSRMLAVLSTPSAHLRQRCYVGAAIMPLLRVIKLNQIRFKGCTSSLRHGRRPARSPLSGTGMASKAKGDPPSVEQSVEPSKNSRSRKRKLGSLSPAAEPVSSPSKPQDGRGMPPAAQAPREETSTDAKAVLPRGQPLKDFVEQWEFRWDLQREAYPWEWGSDGRLSDGPHNIIRCGSAIRASKSIYTCTSKFPHVPTPPQLFTHEPSTHSWVLQQQKMQLKLEQKMAYHVFRLRYRCSSHQGHFPR
jgi:hypothetical protein